MKESQQPTAYRALLGVSALFAMAACATLFPVAGASKPNILGYESLCTFAPAATAACGLLAGITCVIRNRLVKRKTAGSLVIPAPFPVMILALIAALGLWAGIEFASQNSRFASSIAADAELGASLGGLPDGMHLGLYDDGAVMALVELTAKSGLVTPAKLVEGKNIPGEVADKVLRDMVERQSTEVDSVSGATASSLALMRAAERAARPK